MQEQSINPVETVGRLRLFLCHSSIDKPLVRDLYERLTAEGVRVWFDEESLLPGQDWQEEIRKAAREVDAVVICLSPDSIERASYLQKEIKYLLGFAQEQVEGTIFLIPLRLRPCAIPDQLERWQAVDLFDDRGFERLMKSLRLRAHSLNVTIGTARAYQPLTTSLVYSGFVESIRQYEEWLRQQVTIIEPDLERKHSQMKADMLAFFQGSYFRWASLWPAICTELTKAPTVLGVGDLHVSTFGTWRDRDGRLAWGINDFDEAAPLPYTNDLVRLAASALLIAAVSNLKIEPQAVCDSILEGYKTMLERNGRPFILSERHGWLRSLAEEAQPDPELFWGNIDSLQPVTDTLPENARLAFDGHLPSPKPHYRVVRRVSGIGSLGRERYIAVAEWCGGRIAREVKALTPPATSLVSNDMGQNTYYYAEILNKAVRARDLCEDVYDGWIVRRLAPDTSRIEISHVPKPQPQLRLLKAMGRETANIHLGSEGSKVVITSDLSKRQPSWLWRAAEDMVEGVRRDWWEWRRV